MLPDLKQSRREFIATATLASAGVLLAGPVIGQERANAESLSLLPKGPTPAPVPLPHLPSRLHAFIWRNWTLVPVERLASVVGTSSANISDLARRMGLPKNPRITRDQQRRSYITVIKRNWHLLPYEQLLELLGWNAGQLAFTLREDDFLYIKLGSLKPRCAPVKYEAPNAESRAREQQIAAILKQELNELQPPEEALFAFVAQLSRMPPGRGPRTQSDHLRFCYSYFALYGDPLLETEANPYPDGYLARLAETGVNGVWLQGVLQKLAPFPWQPDLSRDHETRLSNLKKLVARAKAQGIRIYLYLNEPRSMPMRFFEKQPDVKGAVQGEHACLCTSHDQVRSWLTNSVASICRSVPDLGGFFTITASENLTNCWSHGGGAKCPRCRHRSPAEVIAGVNAAIADGIEKSGSSARLLAWDWGWSDSWAAEAINRLPKSALLMSVSEWDLPINRGNVATTVGEYSISAIGPGPRAKRHWELARKAGVAGTAAKIQAGNTWELSAVPYIPAVRNVAQHAINLGAQGIGNIMLGWTLGGYPSPNLEVIHAIDALAANGNDRNEQLIDKAMKVVAENRVGTRAAPPLMEAWNRFSKAFSEFPYHIGVVYSGPQQLGPANLLWPEPTQYRATMVGLPYDDLDQWRSVYPPEVFASQLEKVATGFDSALGNLLRSTQSLELTRREKSALAAEVSVAEAAGIHFRSSGNQARFVMSRNALRKASSSETAQVEIARLEQIVRSELALARRLYELQKKDSRIGFEASNQYYYVPIDLVEKILNCRDLLDRWLRVERRNWAR